MEKIRIKYFTDKIEKLQYIGGKSDWIDLRAAEDVEMKAGEFKLIPLGIAMELPKGYEAHVIPRSSTFKNFGILQTNSMGLIDESFAECGMKPLGAVMDYISEDGVVGQVSYGTPMGREEKQFYKDIEIRPMPYGQAMAILYLIEARKELTREVK